MGVSLNPKDQIKGGLIQDVDATLVSIIFAEWTYPGTTTATIAAVGKLKIEGDDDEIEQAWSVGSPSEWSITADGEELESVSGKTGLNDNCNFATFMRELPLAGFPIDKLGDKIGILNGMKAHWIRKAQPKRAGLANQDEREKTTLVPEQIL